MRKIIPKILNGALALMGIIFLYAYLAYPAEYVNRLLRWFEGLEVKTSSDDETLISGEFDQSALYGLFNRIRDLGITLISVQRHSNRNESSPR